MWSRNIMFTFALTCITLFHLIVNAPMLTSAFPFGAGGCTGGQAAVGAPHRFFAKNLTTGTLAQGGFKVTLDGNVLTPGVPFNFNRFKWHTLKLEAASGKYFRGFLFRLAGGTSGIAPFNSLAPFNRSATVQHSIVCENELAGGVTHISSEEKKSVSANLTFPTHWSGLPLDVTVVVENDINGNSTFYYSGFVLNAVGTKTRPKSGKGK